MSLTEGGSQSTFWSCADLGQLARGAVLAPGHCFIPVEHQRSVCSALVDQPLPQGAVALLGERLLGMSGLIV